MNIFPHMDGPSAVALGYFDGVHIGHQALMTELREQSGLIRAVWTLYNHPLSVLRPAQAPGQLTSYKEKKALLTRFGAQAVIAPQFNEILASMPAKVFARDLVEKLRAKVVILGENYRFGKGAEGDHVLMRDVAGALGARVVVLPVIMRGGQPVSSTRIRRELLNCDVRAAADMLGRYYGVAGPVARGRAIGRAMGLPTANIEAEPFRTLPGDGVYAACAVVSGRIYGAVANIGHNPTVGGQSRTMEAHLLDYGGGDLYGRRCELLFVERLRGEIRFASIDELRCQIRKDCERARAILVSEGLTS